MNHYDLHIFITSLAVLLNDLSSDPTNYSAIFPNYKLFSFDNLSEPVKLNN